MSKFVLIDGHSILNRAFYGVPIFTNSEGLHTNAVFGFLNIMFKIIDSKQPDYMAVAFDVHQPTFRHEMFKDYKGTRKPMMEELREQVPVIKELLQKMNITTVELPGYEADDVIGTLSKKGEKAAPRGHIPRECRRPRRGAESARHSRRRKTARGCPSDATVHYHRSVPGPPSAE